MRLNKQIEHNFFYECVNMYTKYNDIDFESTKGKKKKFLKSIRDTNLMRCQCSLSCDFVQGYSYLLHPECSFPDHDLGLQLLLQP